MRNVAKNLVAAVRPKEAVASRGQEAVNAELSDSALASVPATRRQEQSPGVTLRVLHLVNRLDTGGTEQGILKVIRGLDHGFEHGLCTIRGFEPGLSGLPELENRLYVAGRPDAKRELLIFSLARIMRSYRPHIVHSRNWGAIEAVPAARLARVPVAIHSEHGYELEVLAGLPGRQRLLRRVAYAMADAVFTVTDDLRAYHARQVWMSSNTIRVIYNGVDTHRFSPQPSTRAYLRKQLRLAEGTFVIGSVGRMVPIKDYPTLLKAAEILIDRGLSAHVLLVGPGPESMRHQRYIESSPALNGRVSLLGSTDNVSDLLNAMDVFVLPSICEGMSNTLLEAMASGLPVLATRVGGNRELVEENRSGWLFSPGDVRDLAGRLHQLANQHELRCRLGVAARQRAITHFSIERMLQDYRRLYLGLAERRGVLARS